MPMSSMSSLAQAIYAVLFAIGAVLIVSATQKLRAPHRWLEDLSAYQLLPSQSLTLVLAWAVTLIELGIGTTLTLQLFPKEAALAATLLSCAFLAVASFTMVRGKSVSCGCFGELFGESRVGKQTIARLVVLAGTAGLSFIYISSTQSQDVIELTSRIGLGVAFGAPLALLFFLVEITQQVLHMLRPKLPIDAQSTKETTS
jgi:hypothetical protein